MFNKYSISRDCLYTSLVIIILSLVSLFTKLNFLNFKTSEILTSMLSLFSVLFGFILTIIIMLFMFDPTKNPIFKRLQKDNLFNQIFKRFFDSLIIIAISVIFFILTNIYYFKIDLSFWIIPFNSSLLMNGFILFFIILIGLRIYRCLFLLKQIYQVICSNTNK